VVVDYYLSLLPGVPASHARSRLGDARLQRPSDFPLTKKIFERPRLIQRIRTGDPRPSLAHMVCFNSTPLERTLAVRLGTAAQLGRPRAERPRHQVRVPRGVPRRRRADARSGFERLRTPDDIARALAEIKRGSGGAARW
jgi:hypothetical protein